MIPAFQKIKYACSSARKQISETCLHYSYGKKGCNKYLVYISMAIQSNMLNLFMTVKHNARSKIFSGIFLLVYMCWWIRPLGSEPFIGIYFVHHIYILTKFM